MSPGLSQLLRGAAAGIVAIGLFAAAMWINSLESDLHWGATEPIAHEGKVGQVIDADTFKFRADRIDVARSVMQYSNERRTEGIFVIIPARGMSKKEPVSLRDLRLETPEGLRYDDIGASIGAATFEPQLWSPNISVFELPRDRLAGARLIVPQSTPLVASHPEVVVDLGISKAKAKQLIASAPSRYPLKAL